MASLDDECVTDSTRNAAEMSAPKVDSDNITPTKTATNYGLPIDAITSKVVFCFPVNST